VDRFIPSPKYNRFYFGHTRGGTLVARYVDIYNERGMWLNEVKTGYQSLRGTLQTQINKDVTVMNAVDSYHGSALYSAVGGTWWFLPSYVPPHRSGSNFYQQLFNHGINVMLFIYRRGQNDSSYNSSRNWPQMASVSQNWGRYPGIYRYFPPYLACGPGFV
jgi:hypothetical protein